MHSPFSIFPTLLLIPPQTTPRSLFPPKQCPVTLLQNNDSYDHLKMLPTQTSARLFGLRHCPNGHPSPSKQLSLPCPKTRDESLEETYIRPQVYFDCQMELLLCLTQQRHARVLGRLLRDPRVLRRGSRISLLSVYRQPSNLRRGRRDQR